MSKVNKFVVLVFSFRGIFTVEPKQVGFKTKNISFARFQAKIQKKFRKEGTPIAIGKFVPYMDTIRVELVEWLVPWVIKETEIIEEDQHDHLSLLNRDLFDD